MLDQVKRSPEEETMIRSGVGRVYLRDSLNNYLPQAQPVLDMIGRPDWREDLLRGKGAIIDGPPHFADVMVHLIARSALLRAVNCVLIDLPDLHRAMVREEASDATMERLERAAVILIPSFTAAGYDEHPMTRGQVFALERVLTTFLDEGRALVLGTSLPIKSWWSSGLAAHLEERLELITV